jgi:WD40 repeat protein
VASVVLLKNAQLASASIDGFINIWNYTSGWLVDTFREHAKGLIRLCLMKNGYLGSGSNDGKLIKYGTYPTITTTHQKVKNLNRKQKTKRPHKVSP